MDSGAPPTDTTAPLPSEPSVVESEHDRHLREMEASFEALESTVEHSVVRVLKIAVPVLAGVILAAVGTYVLGGFLRDRAERKRVAQAMLIVEADRIRRRRGRRARRRAAGADPS